MKRLIILFYGSLVVASCSCSKKTDVQQQIPQTAENEAALKDLGTKAGMSFPIEARIIAHDNGGRIDPKGGFYQWVIFSSSSVKMPPMQAPGVKDYLDLPLPNSVKSIEVYMGKRKISQPQAAFTSTWETNGFQFRGLLVRSTDGDYLKVERFLKD